MSGRRVVTGWATTSTLDRSNDIVKAEGVTFAKNVPILAAHKHDAPVGKMTKAERIGSRWRVTAELLPAGKSEIADTTWAAVQFGAMPAFSIGFTGQNFAPNDKGGITYSKVDVHEISIVAVPCNPEAVITEVSEAKAAPPANARQAKPKPTTKAKPRPMLLLKINQRTSSYQIDMIHAHNEKAREYNRKHGHLDEYV